MINTNGSYPKRISDLVDNLNKFYPDKTVITQFSIDSYPEEHDKIRKIPGLFQKTMESFKIVKDKGIKVIPSIALTCTQENFKKINEIYEFMKNKHNVKRFSAS